MNNELFRDEDFDTDRIPTEFDLFEAMDRISMIFVQLENALYNHPGLDETQSAIAQKAFQLLFDIYQLAGNRFFELQELNDKDSTQG